MIFFRNLALLLLALFVSTEHASAVAQDDSQPATTAEFTQTYERVVVDERVWDENDYLTVSDLFLYYPYTNELHVFEMLFSATERSPVFCSRTTQALREFRLEAVTKPELFETQARDRRMRLLTGYLKDGCAEVRDELERVYQESRLYVGGCYMRSVNWWRRPECISQSDGHVRIRLGYEQLLMARDADPCLIDFVARNGEIGMASFAAEIRRVRFGNSNPCTTALARL